MDQRETRNLEFKSDITNTFLKTVSAFANYGVGTIIFGISDEGQVIGLSNTASMALDIENKLNDNIHPRPTFKIEINKDAKTISLTVFEGLAKPYYYKNKAYKRSDSSTVEVDRIELNRLIMEGTNQSFDSLPSKATNFEFSKLERKLIEELNIEGLTKDILKSLNLYSDSTGYNQAAELISDQNSFPGVDIVRFGNTIDEFLDREKYEGISIIEQFDSSLSMFYKYYSSERIESSRREKKFLIPEKAFREALANALVHRTWDVRGAILVSMFPDRIEVSSPGGLPFGLSKQEYLAGQISLMRNPIIGNIFFRLKYIEMFGTGIRRINSSYADFIKKPEFKIFENSITVILPNLVKDLGFMSHDERIIFEELFEGIPKSRIEIEQSTSLNKEKIIRILNQLIKKNTIQRIGTGRGTKYVKK